MTRTQEKQTIRFFNVYFQRRRSSGGSEGSQLRRPSGGPQHRRSSGESQTSQYSSDFDSDTLDLVRGASSFRNVGHIEGHRQTTGDYDSKSCDTKGAVPHVRRTTKDGQAADVDTADTKELYVTHAERTRRDSADVDTAEHNTETLYEAAMQYQMSVIELQYPVLAAIDE